MLICAMSAVEAQSAAASKKVTPHSTSFAMGMRSSILLSHSALP